MAVLSEWLERGFERARANIEARPDHLKPAKYRKVSGTATASTATKKRSTRAKAKAA